MKRLLALGTSMAALAASGTAAMANPTWTYTFSGAAMTWTAPSGGGLFAITVEGGQGGSGGAAAGGNGAEVSGTFVFLGGTALNVIVGGTGGSSYNGSGGGGGGSFVTQSGTPLLIAGGGGGVGAGALYSGSPGTAPVSGSTGFTVGTYGSGNSTSSRGAYEAAGYGGGAGGASSSAGAVPAAGYGAGGGGFSGSGQNDTNANGGTAWSLGGAGGLLAGCSNATYGTGGFDGGGAGGCYGGGGGGGYYGGGGGVIGGGGGSLIAAFAINPTSYSGGAPAGPGLVFIDELVSYTTGGGGGGNPAPEPASLALLSAGLVGLGLMRRRRGLLRAG